MIKFKNNKLFKNIIILLVAGGLSKILGMLSKVIYTRIAGINVVAIYTLITPTLMLIITLTQFSFPISISKISSMDKYDNKNLLFNAYTLGVIVDIILIIFILLISSLIASALNNSELKIPINFICLIVIPTTISSIQRGFLHGKEDMFMPSITNIIEEIIKIILIVVILPYFILKENIYVVSALILFNIITEFFTILILNNRIKKVYIKKEKNKIDKKIIKEILKINIPTTLVRLISSIGFFLEPIILTKTLISSGLSYKFITVEYGIINSYIIPLLSMPTFFSVAIASALLPNITKLYYNKKYKLFNKKLYILMMLSMLIGFICLGIILTFPKQILTLVYNINLGVNYLYLIGPFFIILYMQPTLSVAMQAMDKTNDLLKISIISMIIKYTALYIMCKSNLGISSLLYSIIIGIIVTTSLMMIKILKRKEN